MPRDPQPAPRDSRSLSLPAVVLLSAIGLVIAAVYVRTFVSPPILDDWQSVIANRSIRSLAKLSEVLLPDRGATDGRPLLNLSFALNYACGGNNLWGYHLVNLAIHLLATVALFAVVRRTLGLTGKGAWSSLASTAVALAAAALWGLHPMLTEAVTYTSERSEEMEGLFLLLTLYGFMRGVEGKSRGWLRLSVGCCFLAVISKEIAVTAPVIVALFDVTFVGGSFAAVWQRRWYYAALVASWIPLGTLLIFFPVLPRGIGSYEHVSLIRYAGAEAQAILDYLQHGFLPVGLLFDYGPVPPSYQPTITLQELAIVGLLAGSVWLWFRSRPVGFLALAFFVLLSPTSSLVPIGMQPVAESRMYLPLTTLVCGVVAGWWLWSRKLFPQKPWVFAVSVTTLAVVFAVLTFQRNEIYREMIPLWKDTVAKKPDNPRAHDCLGLAFDFAGRHEEAGQSYQRAVDLDSSYVPAQFNLGVSLLNRGDATRAATHLEKALHAPEHTAEANLYLGQALLKMGQPAKAVEPLREASRLDPENSEAPFTLGNTLGALGRYAEAADALSAAVRLAPDKAQVRNNYANALLFAGRTAEAVDQYKLALQQAPGDSSIAANLAQAVRVLDAHR